MEIAMYIVWGLIACIAIFVEINTQIQFGWAISISAIFSIVTHGINRGKPIWVEFAVFITTWAISWFILFLFHKKIFNRIHDKEDGFMYYIGKTFVASKGNEKGFGQIKINDKIFRFSSEEKINKSDEVVVNSIKGVTLIVKKKEIK